MTYHVLARKWRPQTFADLVGQSHVVKALTFALSQNQVHHAYLFTGTRGVGKTSIARIFAKSLNCETNGVSANPCGACESCREITSGKFVDLIEVDAASRTGVDETRELIESVSYRPTKGRYKVYLIDEVHMFSKSSFNALLKTLEEPPEYVKFILATTDPEKLPITILSRCLQFNLKSLTQVQIRQHLINICQAESIEYDVDALSLLANAGDGSMRDTLSLTDQAIAYGQGNLNLAAVTEILGTIHPADIEAILFAISTNNPAQLSSALHRLDDYEIDARAFLIELMRRLQHMAWAKEGIVESLSPSLLSTVGDLPKPLIHLWYDIAEKALPNLSLSGDPRKSVEMTLLRMIAFIPDDWVTRHRTTFDASLAVEGIETINSNTTNTTDTPQTTADTHSVSDETVDLPPPHNTLPVSALAASLEVNSPPKVQSIPPWEDTPATSNHEPHAEPATDFAQHVHAKPITEQESLEAAEIGFMDDVAIVEENMGTGAAQDNSGEQSFVAANASPDNQNHDALHLNADLAASEPSLQTSSLTEVNNHLLAVSTKGWNLNGEASQEQPPSMDDINNMMQRGREINAPVLPTVAVAPVDAHHVTSDNSNYSENQEQYTEQDTAQYVNHDTGLLDVEQPQRLAEPLAASQVEEVARAHSVELPVIQETVAPKTVTLDAQTITENDDSHSTLAAKNTSITASEGNEINHFDWFEVIYQLSLSDYTLHFVSLGLLRLVDDGNRLEALLDLSPKHEVLITQESVSEMQTALQRYFNAPINFSINFTDVYEKTPAEIKQQRQHLDRVSVLTEFSHDPIVKSLTTELGAEVVEKTIRSIN